jgi:hypothetical protein
MPSGPIHLISEVTPQGTEATMLCGAKNVVAAIHEDRVPDYAWDLICPVCLEASKR